MKKEVIFIFGIILLVGFVGAECIDTDGGLNYSFYGEIIFEGNSGPSIIDVCGGFGHYYNSSYVYEGYCTPEGEGTTEVYLCPFGCENGACINFIQEDNETEQFCTDTDGGLNYFVKGTIEYRNLATGEIQEKEDECYDENSIYEYYCNEVPAGNANAAIIDGCPGICLNGACINSTSEDNETENNSTLPEDNVTIGVGQNKKGNNNSQMNNSDNNSNQGNQTQNKIKQIKYNKEQIRERFRERMRYKYANETMNVTLDDEGIYHLQFKKHARLFGFIKIMEKVNSQMDAETGEIIKEQNPWWGFLARDIIEE